MVLNFGPLNWESDAWENVPQSYACVKGVGDLFAYIKVVLSRQFHSLDTNHLSITTSINN